MELPTARNLKIALALVFGFTWLTASAQTNIDDSILYDLTFRTIDSFDRFKVKKTRILELVTIPVEVWDEENKMPRAGAYLSPNDLKSIASQIQHPAIKTWDVGIFSRKAGVKFVTKIGKRECLVVSLPIVSADGQKIVIYYQSMSKRSGAGFVTVWRRTNLNTWTKEKEAMLWIAN